MLLRKTTYFFLYPKEGVLLKLSLPQSSSSWFVVMVRGHGSWSWFVSPRNIIVVLVRVSTKHHRVSTKHLPLHEPGRRGDCGLPVQKQAMASGLHRRFR